MKLYNIHAAYSLANTLYGVTPNETDFEDIAMNAWSLIGTKHTRLYRYITDTVDKKIELPCNCDIIESVHLPINDAQMTSNKTVFNSIDTLFIEGYIDAWKRLDDPLYSRGKLLKYKEGDNTLYFSRDYKKVMIVYHGVINDEESGLPMCNEKEIRAIAAYVGYATLYKDGLKRRDGDSIKMAQMLQVDWLRLCNSARVSEHLSINDMNAILDVKCRWDRKSYSKSYNPII